MTEELVTMVLLKFRSEIDELKRRIAALEESKSQTGDRLVVGYVPPVDSDK